MALLARVTGQWSLQPRGLLVKSALDAGIIPLSLVLSTINTLRLLARTGLQSLGLLRKLLMLRAVALSVAFVSRVLRYLAAMNGVCKVLQGLQRRLYIITALADRTLSVPR